MDRTLQAILVIALLLVSACQRDGDALQRYLSEEHPQLTRGTADVVARFHAIVASAEPADARAKQLDEQVIAPYRDIIAALEGFQPGTDLVAGHHRNYLDAARLQLSAFQATRAALETGSSLERVSGMFDLSHKGLRDWLDAVRKDAEAHGIELKPPS